MYQGRLGSTSLLGSRSAANDVDHIKTQTRKVDEPDSEGYEII
jgi:hypothetical protein